MHVGPSPGHSAQGFQTTTTWIRKRFFRFAIAFTRRMTSQALSGFSYLVTQQCHNTDMYTCYIYAIDIIICSGYRSTIGTAL